MSTRISSNSFQDQEVVYRTTTDSVEVVIERKVIPSGNGMPGHLPIPNPGIAAGLISIEGDNSNGVITWRYTFATVPLTGGGSSLSTLQSSKEISAYTQSAPITMHPDFEKMYQRYGKTMINGRVVWLERDSSSSTSALSKGGGAMVNPMSGIENYYKAGMVYSKIDYHASREEVTENLDGFVAKINSPPGLSGGENWLGFGLTISSQGSGYKVAKKWIYDDRGFLKELYS